MTRVRRVIDVTSRQHRACYSSAMRLHLVTALFLLLAAGCNVDLGGDCRAPVPDSVQVTTFAGIEGELHRLGSCGVASACVAGGQGRLVIYEAGTTTVVSDTWVFDTFRLPLPPGSYDVVIAFRGARADRSVLGAVVTELFGTRITRSYWEDYDYRLLALFFAGDASGQVDSVLVALDVTEVTAVPPASFPEVRVKVADWAHPELVGERALATFPNVVLDYQLDPICTAARWDVEGGGGWPWDDWD